MGFWNIVKELSFKDARRKDIVQNLLYMNLKDIFINVYGNNE